MRVLHIWNTAGVASIIAKYQAKIFKWKTWVIMRKKYDLYGYTTYGELIDSSSYSFVLKSILRARKYDVIHIHDIDIIVPLLKLLYPNKLIILHYHGDSIRNLWKEKQKYWSKADAVIVATPDLLDNAPSDVAVYVPNPVDTELFRPLEVAEKRMNTALFIYADEPKYTASLEWAKTIAKKLGLDLYVHNRQRNPIPHTRLPEFLNKFEYFIDHCWVKALSKTALEALACGLKVIRWDGRVVSNLPKEHEPEEVVKKIKQVYVNAQEEKHAK